MRRNSPIWTIIKLLLLLCIAFLLAMVWWSSNLLEEGLIRIDQRLHKIEFTLDKIKSSPFSMEGPKAKKTYTESKLAEERYPNLFTPDKFYTITLPELLEEENFEYSHIWNSATIGKPNNLHPFSLWADVVNWNSICTGQVSQPHFGIWETYGPSFGYKMEERPREDGKGTEFWIFLRDDIYWKALNPALFPQSIKLAPHFLQDWRLTAEDFKFYYDAIMNPNNQESYAVVMREYYKDIELFEVMDDFTFRVRWKSIPFTDEDGKEVWRHKYLAKPRTAHLSPLASFVFKFYPDGTKIVPDDYAEDTYRTNSTFAQQLTEHWSKNYIPSCGPYEFDGMTDTSIEFKRNRDYFSPYRALNEVMETSFRNNPDTIWNDFKAGKLPVHSLRPEEIPEWEAFKESPIYQQQKANGQEIFRITYLSRMYTYVGWNEKNPLFKSAKVRRALTMAIDRKRLIDQVLNGEAVEISGTIYKGSPNYNDEIKPWAFDPEEAKRILYEEGWVDREGKGILEKEIDGQWVPFSFTVNYFVKSSSVKAIAEFVTSSLNQIGVQAKTHGVDVADLNAKIDDKDFDALIMSWQFGSPPEDPRQLWHSSGAKVKGSSNFISFANKDIDDIIEELDYVSNTEKRQELYDRFSEIIHQEQPYTFLFTSKTNLLYRESVKNVFVPAERQDLIPGANVIEPQSSIYWLKAEL